MANKSGASSQSVALPNGGGALQGIGETFAPDPFTGTGKLSVAIEVPPGRNGLQPKLSLSYSVGNGASPFGLGWELSVPGVSRKTVKGIPRYQDTAANPEERDTFILSGAEDLIAISEPAPGRTRFRPRTEGLFARIERIRTAGRDFWRVASRDGLVSHYGTALSSADEPPVIADPADPTHVYAWKLSETRDPFGNRIEYRYRRDRQIAGSRAWDQLYPEEIRYADFEDAGQVRFVVSVRFVYEERPDPFSECRAGFEIRTRLRCTRIEVRTHAEQDRLLRTYELDYVDRRVQAGELPASTLPPNGLSLLSQVRVVGHDGSATQQLPPLEFGYTTFTPQQQTFRPLQATDGAMTPRSLAHDDFEMVSLFGNGLPDIVQLNGTARVWRNLGGGIFDSAQPLSEIPADVHLRDAGVQIADMNGDGRADLLVLGRNGYFPQSFQGRWSAQDFVQYATSPSVTFDDAELRLLDLDGDGVVDALRTGIELELFLNDPQRGWDLPHVVPRSAVADFPNLHFSDPRVKIADLNGDNLQDLVLVEQGRIEYWPYLGHGRWGGRASMDRSPIFQDAVPLPAGAFDPRRVMLGDLDGDGLDDLVYIEPGRMTFWINRGGNGWSDPLIIDGTPPFPEVDAVRLADVLGTGYQGVLWTADQTGPASAYQFLELTGQVKPYVMESIDNHRGALTRIQYTSSTEFYRADLTDPSTRWKAPLPIPLQVVKRIEVVDQISGGKLTTEYRYHHGYWDGLERELRGFGLVDQLDTESFDNFHATGLHGAGVPFVAVDTARFSPPTLTRTWFHLGDAGEDLLRRGEIDFSSEYWSHDPPALERPADTIDLFERLTGRAKAAALRCLRGSVLRTELYALDGTSRAERPFTVTESQYGVHEVDPPLNGSERLRSFFPHLVAQRISQWDRGEEPLTKFAFTDKHDQYGQSRRRITLAVPRGRDFRASAPTGSPYLGTCEETRFAQRDDDERYIVDRVAASETFEILNDGSQPLLDLAREVQAGVAARALFAQVFNYYDGEAFTGLPVGQLQDFGALVRSESLALTKEQLQEVYRDPVDPDAADRPPYLRPDGPIDWPAEYPPQFRQLTPALAGYSFADGSDHRARGYFTSSAQVAFDFQVSGQPPRGLPVAVRDALGGETSTLYDRPFHLLPVQATDPLGLATRVEYDYRLLQPRLTTDANGNRQAVIYSPLGLVAATATMGKEGEQAGDTLEVPGQRLEYDFLAFDERKQPISVRVIARQHHVADTHVPLPARDETLEVVEYSDGFGRQLQTRTGAEDVLFGVPPFGGGVLSSDQSRGGEEVVGRKRASGEPPNVVVSGWQVYDNKGHVIEVYEPFFSTGFEYGKPDEAHLGQKASIFYDAFGRSVRTMLPNGSEQRVVYGVPSDLDTPDDFAPTPWETYSYDANDLAPVSLHPTETLPDGSPKPLADRTPATHHWTPASFENDPLGRTVLSVARSRDPQENPTDPLPPIQEVRTSASYDVRGNLLTTTDALGRTAFSYVYDLTGRAWRVESIDGGVRRLVFDGQGNEVERRDSKGALLLQSFDTLRRPTRLWARDDTNGPVSLRQRVEYGDDGDPAQPEQNRAAMRARNLLGQLVRHFDEAGLTIVDQVDFKGNVVEKNRRVIADAPVLAVFDQGPTEQWRITPFQVNWEPRPQQSLTDREQELLETVTYQTAASYDALNRVTRLRLPRDVEGHQRELHARYNRAGGLEHVLLDEALFVERIAYDAKGQRLLIAYGNGVMTRYDYDPHTFRLSHLRSERYSQPDEARYHPTGAPLQDFAYDYDLVGNIVGIRERVPGCGIPNNPEAASVADAVLAQLLAGGNAFNRRFDYDPLNRLLAATGRECDLPPEGLPWEDQPRCTDLTRARAYAERYRYDAAGNLLQLSHRSGQDGFTRTFNVEADSNHLRQMAIGQETFAYHFDPNGNLLSETTSRHFEWSHADRLKAFRTQTEGAEPSVHAHYLYDAAGQRVKKLVRKQGGQVEVTHYVDGVFEHQRWSGAPQAGENNHVHVMDDSQRIALVRVGPAHPDDRGSQVKYQLADHLGSSSIVLDGSGELTNREEFTPYGETSFGSFSRKRYRFNGLERDEESGLNYHGARYYVPGLARWASCDPAGAAAGLNQYVYALNSPLCLIDPAGTQPTGLTQDEEGNYILPDQTIEITGTRPPPDALELANQRGLSHTLNRAEYEKKMAWEDRSDPYQLKKAEEYWRQRPDEWEEAWDRRLTEEYLAYRHNEAVKLEKAYRRMEAAGNVGNAIGWVTVGVIGVATGGELLLAASESTAAYSVGTSLATSTSKVMAVEFAYGFAAPPGAPDLFPGPGPDDLGRGMQNMLMKMVGGATKRTKPISLPSWSKVTVDMAHIAERHMHGGAIAEATGRSLFPITMKEPSVLRAIREAYGSATKTGVQGDRIKLVGVGEGLKIEMWFNRVTRVIESAYPIL